MSSIWDAPGETTPAQTPAGSAGGGGSIWSSPGSTATSTSTTAPSGGGGGGFLHGLTHDLGSVGHFISTRAATGMSTIKSIGTGLYGAAKTGAIDPWWNLITTGHPYAHNTGNKIDAETNAVLGGTIVGPVNAVHDVTSGHFKDPIGDVIQFLPAAHGLARTGIGAAEAGAALRSGEGVGAAAKAFKSPEFLQSPRLVGEPGREPVSLYGSHNAARRLVQAGIDRTVNKALANDRANGLLGHEGPIAKYGKARMGGTVADYARASIRYRQAMVATTRVAARGVARFAKSIKADVENPELTAQALLHSLHDNVLPEHEAILHEQQAARGINPEQNAAWARAFNDAAKLNAVHLTPDDRVVINEGHPLTEPLARADNSLAKLGAYAENQIVTRGLREPLELADRRGRVAQLVQRGKPLLGEEPQPLREARRSLANTQRKLQTALDRETQFNAKQEGRIAKASQRTGGPSVELGSPHREAIVQQGHALELAKQRVQALEDRYGFSSPERRAAQQQGVMARERLQQAAHRLFGSHAASHLAQIESFARQWARVTDRSPEEWYAQFLRDTNTPHEIGNLPEDIAPLYEAQPALARTPHPQLDSKSMAQHVLERSDIKLPKGWTNVQLEAAFERVLPLVEEGAPYRDWYARGAAVLKDAAERIGAKAGKKLNLKNFLNVVAITSQGANPTMNLRVAARAAEEFLRTGKVTHENARFRFPQRQIPEVMDAMRGKVIESNKRNSYYGNFLHEIDPKQFASEFGARLDPVTVDRHIARMLFDTTSPTDVQYKIGEAIFQEIAKQLGWKAKEVQAAAWVPFKARGLEESAVTRAQNAGRIPVPGGFERHMPSAGDAYERGHQENIGTLYQQKSAVQHAVDMQAGHDLEGLPSSIKVNGEPVQWHSYGPAQDIAASYMQKAGLPYEPPRTYAKVDPERARAIAAWYDKAIHAPADPGVARAYDAMARETLAQYHEIVDHGYTFEFYPPHDPYPGGPREAILDLIKNKHMYVFPTDEGFGTLSSETQHPLLADSGVRWNGKVVTHNDVFRAVHDFFGHAKEGVGFRADGEENAWRSHSAMYSPEARAAMTAETRGQNSWVNYGPHGEANRTASQMDTVYADQKAVVAPHWVVYDGAGDAPSTLYSAESFHEAAARELAAYAEMARDIAKTIPESEWPRWVHNQLRLQSSGEMEKALQDSAGGMTFPEEWLHQMLPGDVAQKILGAYHTGEGRMELSAAHAQPDTILHEALHAVRQSLTPTISEIARRIYAPNGWDRAAEERFAEDMQRAANGEPVSPEAQRLYTMTHQYTPGRGYVPMSIYEAARQAHSPMSSSPGPIIGQTKQPLETKYATGEATAQGLRRTDVAEAVTQHVQKLFRYFNTIDHRDLAAKFGSDTSMSKGDVLVRYDRRTEAGYKLPAQKVSSALKETLGLLENKTGLPAPEEEGLSAGVAAVLRDFVGEMFPKLGSDPELRRVQDEAAATGRGVQAPAGYKWVPEEIARLKDLEAAVTRGEPGRIGRFADNVNGAITAATVYYKVGHVFTRVLTNASTNILQGSAAPWQIARSVQLWHALTEDEIHEALAYAGTHYYEAAPGATGGTVVGKGLQKGLHVPFTDVALRTKSGEAVMSPQWWAHNIDAPFRFNSLAFEARQAGYEGVDGFRSFLQDVQHYKGLDSADRARVDGVLRRADREAIAYDRMNQFEKKWLSRIIWFYPWIKGSTVFTANSILEHPFKTAALYGYGEQGAQERDKALGDLPSYAQGLTPLTGGSEPVVADFNTFNPFSTAGDLLGVPEHLQNAAGMANPFYGAILNTAEGVNPYGAHTPTPISDNLKGLLTSAPEYQILEGAMNNGDQSHKLYPGGHGLDPLYKNWLGELVRSLGGPATPRHVNPNAGHSLAQRERTGR